MRANGFIYECVGRPSRASRSQPPGRQSDMTVHASIRPSCASTTSAASSAKTLNPADAQAIGRTFGTMVRRAGGRTVALGYDGRLSSPSLQEACVAGLREAGIDVLRVGMCATPMLYFAVYDLDADGGIMITGSHNPPDYNGFKMMFGKKPFYGADILKLGAMSQAGDVEKGAGSLSERPVKDAYVARVLRDFRPGRTLKVVWDTGHGAMGMVIRDIASKLPGEHTVLFERVDGTFPAHHPDPTVEKNLLDLRAAVKERGADVGIAFDGDGDRIGALDGQGRILWGDQLLAIWARDVLRNGPARRSSPTSRQARCCSTRSRPPAASR